MKILTIILVLLLGVGKSQAFADAVITFGPKEAKIIGSIPYSVIGKYTAQFASFEGRIVLDDQLARVQSVYLSIDANSIHSSSQWCDKLARSRRLLNAMRYPKIIFRGDQIIHDQRGYKVNGVLEMHGIKRRMIFPFNCEIINDQGFKRKLLILHGSWAINRKRFNIIWNRYLDHGGVLVGNNFTVNWEIKVNT